MAAITALLRSMHDSYSCNIPFRIINTINDKIRFIHTLYRVEKTPIISRFKVVYRIERHIERSIAVSVVVEYIAAGHGGRKGVHIHGSQGRATGKSGGLNPFYIHSNFHTSHCVTILECVFVDFDHYAFGIAVVHS